MIKVKNILNVMVAVAMVAVAVTVTNKSWANSDDTTVESRRLVLDKVIAVVGNSSILSSDLDAQIAQIEMQRRRAGYTSDRPISSEALEQLLTQRLLYTQGVLDSVEINELNIMSQIEMQISSMSERVGGLIELEKSYNMEVFNIREMLRRTMKVRDIADQMRVTVLRDVTIVPGEVERYYKRHDRDSLPVIGEQYRYAQISRFPSSIDDAKRRVRERLMNMRRDIINGDSKFTFLAQMYSLDPGSAYRGGEMEPQPSSAFVPAFADALEMLQPGQVSEVVESEFGFHIIELIEKKGDLYHCRHILLRPEFTTDELMEPINFLDSLANQIRLDSVTFEKAAMEYSDDKSSKMNGGIVTNHDMLERYNAYDAKLTVTKFLKEDFGNRGYKSLDDYNALMKLDEGGVSDAFATEDMTGNQLAKIVKLVKVYPAHTASIDKDYLRIEDLALDDKRMKVLDEWIDKKIQSTYIYIDPEYRDQEFENPNWVK